MLVLPTNEDTFRSKLFPMADEHANTDSEITEAVRILKLKILASDHGAVDSRVQELMNDPSIDDDDIISILPAEMCETM